MGRKLLKQSQIKIQKIKLLIEIFDEVLADEPSD